MPKNGRLRRNQNWHGICIIYRHQDIYEQHELKDKEKSLKRKKGKVNMKKKAISLLLVGAITKSYTDNGGYQIAYYCDKCKSDWDKHKKTCELTLGL